MPLRSTKPPAPNRQSQRPPLTVASMGMWIFISTEIMLFAAIIAVYLVFRFSSIGTGWPSPFELHVSIVAGIANTVVLVVSAMTAWGLYNATREGRSLSAKLWLIATLLLGITFLAIKGYEYQEKYRVGLLPVPGETQIHHEPNVHYVAHVKQRLKEKIAALEIKKSRLANAQKSLTEDESQRLELLYDLKQHLVEATAQTVGQTRSAYHAHLCIKLMAWQIFPNADVGLSVEEVFGPEKIILTHRKQSNLERLELVREREELVERQIEQIEQEIEQDRLLDTGAQDNPELKSREEWLAAKRNQKKQLAVEAKEIESTLKPIKGRLEILNNTTEGGGQAGINAQHGLRLPVVVPNGNAWMSAYLILTGAHAVHLIGGLIAFLWWLPRKLTPNRASGIYLTCMYWQFVDIIWLCIFWLIYF